MFWLTAHLSEPKADKRLSGVQTLYHRYSLLWEAFSDAPLQSGLRIPHMQAPGCLSITTFCGTITGYFVVSPFHCPITLQRAVNSINTHILRVLKYCLAPAWMYKCLLNQCWKTDFIIDRIIKIKNSTRYITLWKNHRKLSWYRGCFSAIQDVLCNEL